MGSVNRCLQPWEGREDTPMVRLVVWSCRRETDWYWKNYNLLIILLENHMRALGSGNRNQKAKKAYNVLYYRKV